MTYAPSEGCRIGNNSAGITMPCPAILSRSSRRPRQADSSCPSPSSINTTLKSSYKDRSDLSSMPEWASVRSSSMLAEGWRVDLRRAATTSRPPSQSPSAPSDHSHQTDPPGHNAASPETASDRSCTTHPPSRPTTTPQSHQSPPTQHAAPHPYAKAYRRPKVPLNLLPQRGMGLGV